VFSAVCEGLVNAAQGKVGLAGLRTGFAAIWPGRARRVDEQVAESLFKAGQELYNSGSFVEAAKVFVRAAAKSPKDAVLFYNAANAFDKAGERKSAIEWYKKYLASGARGREEAISSARLQVLERELAESAPGGKRGIPAALPFVEPVTKHTFQTVTTFADKPYTLIGVGARKVMGFKVYAMGLYLEDEPARRAFPKLAAQAGGSDRETLLHSDLAYKFIVLGEFGRMAMLHFVRAVSADDTRKSYREALTAAAGPTASTELKRDIEAFLQLFEDVKEGDDVIIRTTADGQLSVESKGKNRVGPKSLRLSHDVWDIWLGNKPISADLKRSIVDRIDTLGR
jgi:tetratricopeptide (TPR) repeat protein